MEENEDTMGKSTYGILILHQFQNIHLKMESAEVICLT